jgi:hypothetical protein
MSRGHWAITDYMMIGGWAKLCTISLAVALVAAGGNAPAQTAWNLTGGWRGSAGNVLQLRQSGTTVTWFARAADREAWAHDFTGTISGDVISGTFQDRPGYQIHNSGVITARITDDCHFVITGVGVNGAAPSGGGEQFTKTPCSTPRVVSIATVSNGCGGAGWDSVVAAQNYLGNTSKYADSNVNPIARTYPVNFKDACDLHDAGYSGAVVHDKLSGRTVDFRTWSRKRVDEKFFDDMRYLCRRQLPATTFTALKNCQSTGGNFSVGAKSRYNFVRCWGNLFFDADPDQPARQSTGPRHNDKVSSLSSYCRFAK